jgi:hypothetical protein
VGLLRPKVGGWLRARWSVWLEVKEFDRQLHSSSWNLEQDGCLYALDSFGLPILYSFRTYFIAKAMLYPEYNGVNC